MSVSFAHCSNCANSCSPQGIGLSNSVKMLISTISEDGLFAGSGLRVGQKVLSINNVDCRGMSSGEAVRMLRTSVGQITVVADDHPEALAEEVKEDPNKTILAPATERDNVSVRRDSRTASLPFALSQSMSIDISTFLEDASNAGTDLFSQEEPTSSSVCQFFGMFSCAPHQNEEESEVSEEKERINNIDEADSVSEGGDTLITTDDLSKGDRKPDEDSDVLITTDDLNMGDGKSDGSQGKKSKEMDIDQQRQSSAFDPVGHLLLNQYGSCESSLTQTLGEDSRSSRDAKAKSVGIKKKLAKKLLPKRLRSSRPASAAKQRSVLDSVPEAFMSVPESAPESAVLAAIKSAPESVQREYYDAVSKTAVIAAEAELRRAQNELKKVELESRRLDDEMSGFLDSVISNASGSLSAAESTLTGNASADESAVTGIASAYENTVTGNASADESTVVSTLSGDLSIVLKHISRPFLSFN